MHRDVTRRPGVVTLVAAAAALTSAAGVRAPCQGTSLGLQPQMLCPVSAGAGVVVAYGDVQATCIALHSGQTGRVIWKRQFRRISFVGQLCTHEGVVYVPTYGGGALALNLRDGTLRGRLDAGGGALAPKIACMAGRVIISGYKGKSGTVTGFDAAHLRPVWERAFTQAEIMQVVAKAGVVEVLLAQPDLATDSWQYERVRLGASDGHPLSRAATARPAEYDVVPKNLPNGVRKRLTQLLKRKEGVFLRRTPILRRGNLLFVGNQEDLSAPSRVYAIGAESGDLFWQQSVQGLACIALNGSRVILACGLRTPYATRRMKSLVAVDASTGHVLWMARLTCASRGR